MPVIEAKVQGLDHLYNRFILRKYGTSKVKPGRDSSSLFQIPIFGDACLIPPSIQSRIWSFPVFMRSLKGSSSFLHFMLTSSGPWVVLDLLAFVPSRFALLPIGKAILGQRPNDPFSSSRRPIQIHFFSSSFFAFNC
ncbi:hypothetical protein V6N13_069398 [Hibiscus sabdariffa]